MPPRIVLPILLIHNIVLCTFFFVFINLVCVCLDCFFHYRVKALRNSPVYFFHLCSVHCTRPIIIHCVQTLTGRDFGMGTAGGWWKAVLTAARLSAGAYLAHQRNLISCLVFHSSPLASPSTQTRDFSKFLSPTYISMFKFKLILLGFSQISICKKYLFCAYFIPIIYRIKINIIKNVHNTIIYTAYDFLTLILSIYFIHVKYSIIRKFNEIIFGYNWY